MTKCMLFHTVFANLSTDPGSGDMFNAPIFVPQLQFFFVSTCQIFKEGHPPGQPWIRAAKKTLEMFKEQFHASKLATEPHLCRQIVSHRRFTFRKVKG